MCCYKSKKNGSVASGLMLVHMNAAYIWVNAMYEGMDYLLIDSILTFGTKRGSGKFFMKVLSIHRKGRGKEYYQD